MSRTLDELKQLNIKIRECVDRIEHYKTETRKFMPSALEEQQFRDAQKALDVLNQTKEGMLYLVSESTLVKDEFMDSYLSDYREDKDE